MLCIAGVFACPVVLLGWLTYKPYFFSQRIIFFSHAKSINNTFSHGLSVKQTQTNRTVVLHLGQWKKRLSRIKPVCASASLKKFVCRPAARTQHANHLSYVDTCLHHQSYVDTCLAINCRAGTAKPQGKEPAWTVPQPDTWLTSTSGLHAAPVQPDYI